MCHGGRVQDDREDRVDDEVVDGLWKDKGQHKVSDHVESHSPGPYPVGSAGELYVVVVELMLQPDG